MQVRHVLGWCSFRDPGCPVQEQLGEKRCSLRELGLWEQREQQDVQTMCCLLSLWVLVGMSREGLKEFCGERGALSLEFS